MNSDAQRGLHNEPQDTGCRASERQALPNGDALLQSVQLQLGELQREFDRTHLRIAQYLEQRQAAGHEPRGSGSAKLDLLLSKVTELEGAVWRLVESPRIEAASLPAAAAGEEVHDVDGSHACNLIGAEVVSPLLDGDAHGNDSAWLQAIFGLTLVADPQLQEPLDLLRQQILQGERSASALAGELLIFGAAAAESKPKLLTDVGEAFYRWRGESGEFARVLEQPLIAWLQECCEQAGLTNTVEIVHPGERFHSTRHRARGGDRGAVITEVYGWIVLRASGEVLTKANVAVG